MKPYNPNKYLQEHFEHVLAFNGYSIYDIEHSIARYIERVG